MKQENNKKEVMFLSNFFGHGGAARVIHTLAHELYNNGYSVYVCSFKGNFEEYKQEEGIKHLRITIKARNGFFKRLERIRSLRRVFKCHPDATLISFEYFLNMQVILAHIFLKNKLIVSERNDPASMGGRFPISVIRNILYKHCDTLVCQTNDAKDYFPKPIQSHSCVIMNPLREDLPVPPKINGFERKHIIVNFCRLEKQKNLKLLIDAFKIFRESHEDYKLHIFGDGSEKGDIINYIQKNELMEHVHIFPPRHDIHRDIIEYMMFVSSSNYEGLSNSMIEAMAIGLPVICTDCPCGGSRMVIKSGYNGILIPVNDRRALVDAMTSIAENEETRNELSAQSRIIRNTLNADKITRQWIEIIER